MARFNPHKLTRNKQEQIWDDFCDSLMNLKSRDEVKRFFRDLLNRTERTMLARRLEIAILLEIGFSYKEIENILRAGTGTISKVHRWLNFGRNGYKLLISKRIRENHLEYAKKYIRLYK